MSFQKLKFQLLISSVQVYLNTLSYFSQNWAGTKAAQLFGTPRKGRLSDADRERLKSAEWVNLQLNDIKIQCYHWQGDAAKTVVLMHGWESNTARWHPLIKLLRKENFNVVAFDAPAHGGSGGRYFEAKTFAEMLDVVVQHFQPQYIVGHSVGGYAAAYWAGHFYKNNSQFPTPNTQLRKLILMASPSDIGKVFDKFLDFIKANARVRYGFYRHLEAYVGKKIADIKAEDMLKSLTINTLIIHDKNDDVIEFTEGVKINAQMPSSIFIPTENFGHRLRDSAVNLMVINFLKN